MSRPNQSPNKQRKVFCALCAFLVLLVSLTASAVPPANDACSGAVVIPSKGPFPVLVDPIEITDATTAGDPTMKPLCQTNVTRSIWYQFTPTNSEFYTFSTCPDDTTVSDTVLAIYTNALGCSSPSTFSLIACADDSSGGCLAKAVLTAPLTASNTYYIIAWQWSDAQITPGKASIKMVVSKALAPPNDTCQNAQPLGLNMPVYGSTVAANNNYETTWDVYMGLGQVPSSAGGRDVVYTFTAPATDTYSVKVYDYSSSPNELVVYATPFCPAAGPTYTFDTVISAANRVLSGSSEELFCMPLEQDQQIYIVVDEDAENVMSPGSTFRIEVNRCRMEQLGNSYPETASPLPPGVEGVLQTRWDENWFSLGTFAEGSRAFVLVDSSATSPTDFEMQILTNTTIFTDIIQYAYQNNPEAYGAYAANVAGAILPEGPTYVRIFDPVLAKEPYRLYAVVQPPMALANWEVEPNNSYEGANSATNNYNYFRGALESSSDVDVFHFTAMGGDLIFASLDCDPLRNLTPIEGRMQLLDADGKSLVSVDTVDTSSATNRSETSPYSPSTALTYRVADEGEFDFYIRVSISPTATGPLAAGDYLLSIAKNCFADSSGANTPPVLTNLTRPETTIEGGTVALGSQIIDPDTGEAFTVSINWGDGSELETINPGAGVYGFATSHLYVDNGNFSVTLTVSDYNGGSVVSNLVAVITNGAPTLTAFQATTESLLEGGTFTVGGSISDPGALDRHTVVINWGDGSAVQTNALAEGVYDFGSSHVYADNGSFPITLTVSDNNGGNVVSNLLAVITNGAPTLTAFQATTGSLLEGGTFTVGGSISDPGALDRHTVVINWGDGSAVQTNALAEGVYDFGSSHVYADNGSFPITLTVGDNAGGSVVSNLVAVVMNAAPGISALQVRPGTIFENDQVTLDGSFLDYGVRDTHAVVIDWGDGSTASTLNLSAGVTNFSTTHRYLDDSPTGTGWDTYTIGVTVTDNYGSSGSSTTSVVVSNLPPVITSATLSPASLMPNQTAHLSVSFTDAGTRDVFTYSVNWGDGSAVETQRAASPISLNHLYTLANTNLSVSLSVQDDDGGSASTNLPLTIQLPDKAQLTLSLSNTWYWVKVQGSPNVAYRLQVSTNLPAWNDLSTLTLNASGVAGVNVTNNLSARPRFFRAVFP